MTDTYVELDEQWPPIYCESCGQNFRDPDVLTTCTPKNINGLQGLPYAWDYRIVPEEPPADQCCQDCWVPLGAWHHWLCHVERCPWCNEQLLYCGHYSG